MIRTLSLLTLVAVLLSACKPTERTALKKKQMEQQAAQVVAPPQAEPAPQPAAPAPIPAPAPLEPADCQLVVAATQQDYNPLRPWEKDTPLASRALGVYMGEGRVLTMGRVVRAATYVELMLPDESRSVSARVLRYDEDMNLALLTVANEDDADIFESRTALPLGEALTRGDKAMFTGLLNGVEPVHVDLQAESVEGSKIPLMVMRAARPLPEGLVGGSPVVREGKLSALGLVYKKQEQLLHVVNAELIQRFLTQEQPGVPVIGVQLTPLDDPLFRRYLKLDESASGLYISKVQPGSAAEEAGVKKGDVLTALEGMPLDNQGRCNHPRYGLHQAASLLRAMKDQGQELQLTLSREGETLQVSVKLDRKAVENSLFRPQKPGVQPRYIMWGGLLFQPLTATYMNELRSRSNGLLPLELQMLEQAQEELREAGCTELVGLTYVLPTVATQGYDDLRFCRLIAVNGQPVKKFEDLPELLDAQTEDGIIRLEFNKAPYTVYVDRAAVDAVNSQLQQQAIPNLRVVE
ncbi:MAG: PDZ domain-containing protein [Akkermansia sp.]|nr:PDZ domain-containing protein [Akkermansia sp.]